MYCPASCPASTGSPASCPASNGVPARGAPPPRRGPGEPADADLGTPFDAGHDAGEPVDADRMRGSTWTRESTRACPRMLADMTPGLMQAPAPETPGSAGAWARPAAEGDAGLSCSAELTCQDSVCASLWTQWPAPGDGPGNGVYTDNGDGTVTDTATSPLIWEKTQSASTRSWSGAQTYCQGLTLHSLSTGWRSGCWNEGSPGGLR